MLSKRFSQTMHCTFLVTWKQTGPPRPPDGHTDRPQLLDVGGDPGMPVDAVYDAMLLDKL